LVLDSKKVYFEWNQNNDLGPSTYFKLEWIVSQLVTSTEAAFSKVDFKLKPESEIAYYIDKGAVYAYTIKSKTNKKSCCSNPVR
jgi:hypothetical protein